MNRAVYAHILATYGRKPGMWIALVLEIIRTLLQRVIIVLFIAQAGAKIAAGDFDGAKHSALLYILGYLIGIAIGAITEILFVSTENRQYGRMMMRYYELLTTKDMSFYRDHQTGYLTSLYRQYLDGILVLVRSLRGDVTRTIVSLTAPVIILCFISPPIGLVMLGIIVVQIFYVFWASKKSNIYRKKTHEVYRAVSGEVSDTLTNIVAFRGAGQETQARNRMQYLTNQETSAYLKRHRLHTYLDIPRLSITAIGVGLGIYTIAEYHDPTIVGLVILTFSYLLQITRNVSDLPSLVTSIDDNITKIYPTLAYLNDDQKIRDPVHPKKLTITTGAIELKNVNFAYTTDDINEKPVSVFENLSLSIKGGEQVGIVGLSGAGKSTLVSLLLRFDDRTSGEITIDGTDIADVKQTDLHKSIAYVPQEPLLFHRSIKDNISYFNPTASEEELIKATKAAHAHEFIQKLPKGYDTIVGERGVKLSGGQKQRVVIARAILKNAPIFIFDEATSALDSESEHIIQQSLPGIIGKHTALVIAHRLSTVAPLDRIVVMHSGAIVEQGTHEELLALGGRYFGLWERQTRQS